MPYKFSKYDILIGIALFSLVGYLIAAYYFVNDVGKNKCSMTYMYEYPQYVVSDFHSFFKILAFMKAEVDPPKWKVILCSHFSIEFFKLASSVHLL